MPKQNLQMLCEVTWRGQWTCEGIIYLDSKRQNQLRQRVRRKERKRAYMSKVWLYGNNAELIVSANHSKAKGLWSLVVFFHKASVPRCLHMSSSLLFLSALIKSYDCVITIQGHGYQGLLLCYLKLLQCICALIKSLVTQIHDIRMCEIVCRQMASPCVHTVLITQRLRAAVTTLQDDSLSLLRFYYFSHILYMLCM